MARSSSSCPPPPPAAGALALCRDERGFQGHRGQAGLGRGLAISVSSPWPPGEGLSHPRTRWTGRAFSHRVSAQNAWGDLRQGDLGMSLCLSASLTLTHTYTRAHTYMYLHAGTHIFTHAYAHIHVPTHMHTRTQHKHMHTRSHTHAVYSHAQAHTRAHIQSRTCLHVYLHHIRVCTYTHIPTHTYAYAQAHTSPSAAPFHLCRPPTPVSWHPLCQDEGEASGEGAESDTWPPGLQSEQGEGAPVSLGSWETGLGSLGSAELGAQLCL